MLLPGRCTFSAKIAVELKLGDSAQTVIHRRASPFWKIIIKCPSPPKLASRALLHCSIRFYVKLGDLPIDCTAFDCARDNSQRQLATDHDYAVSTREYQTDQSSLKPAPTAARSVLEKQLQQQRLPHRFAEVDTVTPYQGEAARHSFRRDV